jgi:hypothetical protein
MITKLFRASAALRESIHLPRLAKKATSAPVLGTFTLVMGHDPSPRAYRFGVDADY